MADNVISNPGSGGATFATRSVTYSSDSATHIAVNGIVAFSGSDDAKTVADIPGDATNGLDVDVTRLPTLVAGTAIIGKVGIDQTTPGTTNAVSVTTRTASTATLANVSGSATSVTLIASNANRLGAAIVNDSTAALYIKCGSTASATSYTYKLQPGDTLDLVPSPIYTGILTGIWDSATGSARTTEFTA